MNPGRVFIVLAAAATLSAQNAQVVKVESKPVNRTVLLAGEFLPYERVDLHARVSGFVERFTWTAAAWCGKATCW